MEFAQFLQDISVGDVGFATLLSFAIYLILTGRIVPRSVVDDIRSDRDARIQQERDEKNIWREVASAQEKRADAQNDQLKELIEYARTTDHLIRAIQADAEDR